VTTAHARVSDTRQLPSDHAANGRGACQTREAQRRAMRVATDIARREARGCQTRVSSAADRAREGLTRV
jgi:hypothetical protein